MEKTASLYCALDSKDLKTVEALANKLSESVDGFKLGLEFFCSNGQEGIERIKTLGLPLFLDLKLHDIPNTVAGAVRSIAPFTPNYLTVHASGGSEMLKAAVSASHEEAERLNLPRIKLLAVTILTSLSHSNLESIGMRGNTEDAVVRLAALSAESGIDGLVCSPKEIGIRPLGTMKNDQKRASTPKEAILSGATALVVGRPITQADNPSQKAKDIQAEIRSAK